MNKNEQENKKTDISEIKALPEARISPNRDSRKFLLSFVMGLIIGSGATWLWGIVPGVQDHKPEVTEETTNEEKNTSTENVAGANAAGALNAPGNTAIHENNSLMITDQEAGKTVVVDKVVLANGGWVVVHEIGEDGVLQNALGAGRFPKGESSGVLQLLRGTTAGNTYVGLLYSDDGDRVFELQGDDKPLASADGRQIAVTFTTR